MRSDIMDMHMRDLREKQQRSRSRSLRRLRQSLKSLSVMK